MEILEKNNPDILAEKPYLRPERMTALITGATSGIGKSFAREFARQHYDLIITGRRQELLHAVADDLRREFQVSVQVIIADFSHKDEVRRLIDAVTSIGNIEVIVNNAGYGLGAIFHLDDLNHQLNMVNVHVLAPLMIIHALLPSMISRNRGIIINVSSLAAFFPTKINTLYSGTKSFMLNFSESLQLEVKKHGIRVQCLCPGLTHTDFHDRPGFSVRPKKSFVFNWLKPDDVVRQSLRGLEKKSLICVPGMRNKLAVKIVPLLPRRLYYALADRLDESPLR